MKKTKVKIRKKIARPGFTYTILESGIGSVLVEREKKKKEKEKQELFQHNSAL